MSVTGVALLMNLLCSVPSGVDEFQMFLNKHVSDFCAFPIFKPYVISGGLTLSMHDNPPIRTFLNGLNWMGAISIHNFYMPSFAPLPGYVSMVEIRT